MKPSLKTHLIIESLTKSLREVDSQLSEYRQRSPDLGSHSHRNFTPPPGYSTSKTRLYDPKKRIGAGGSYVRNMAIRKSDDPRYQEFENLKDVERQVQDSELYLMQRQQTTQRRESNPKELSLSELLLQEYNIPRLSRLEEELKQTAHHLEEKGYDMLRQERELELREQELKNISDKLRDKENKLHEKEGKCS